MINKKICVKPKELINSGAELCEISTTAAKRYLDKMCSKEGLCTRLGGRIRFDAKHPLFKGEIERYDGIYTNIKLAIMFQMKNYHNSLEI